MKRLDICEIEILDRTLQEQIKLQGCFMKDF